MNKKKKGYPGFLLYFDRVEGLFSRLGDEQLGYICRMMYNYARYGKEPEEMPEVYALIWPELRTMLDDDRAAYEEKCAQGEYAAACRVAEAKHEPKPQKEQFFENRRTDRQLTEEEKFEENREKALRKLYAYTNGKLL